MKMKFVFVLVFSCLLTAAQERKIKKLDYFPNERLFPLIYLDPLTCQTYGGIHILFEESNKNKGVYIPVNLGFSQPFFGYNNDKTNLELGLEAASYTQFEIVHVEGNTYLGGLYNNDYKSSVYLSVYYNSLYYRIRLFHISSHLGDDYMIRNEVFSRNDQSVNYEQVDLTILKRVKNIEYYFGAGYVVSPNAFRERLSFQAGLQFNIENEKAYHLIGGLDIKSFVQNNYYPNIRAAIGTEYSNRRNPAFRIQLEFYHGHLPYSTHEYRRVTWLGISSVIEIAVKNKNY